MGINKMKPTPELPAKKRGPLKSFFYQYLLELNEWNSEVRRGVFFALPSGVAGIFFVVELIRTYILSTESAFLATLAFVLFKSMVMFLGVVAVIIFCVGVYVVWGLLTVKFLEWVKE